VLSTALVGTLVALAFLGRKTRIFIHRGLARVLIHRRLSRIFIDRGLARIFIDRGLARIFIDRGLARIFIDRGLTLLIHRGRRGRGLFRRRTRRNGRGFRSRRSDAAGRRGIHRTIALREFDDLRAAGYEDRSCCRDADLGKSLHWSPSTFTL
jgi:hypothetical protein